MSGVPGQFDATSQDPPIADGFVLTNEWDGRQLTYGIGTRQPGQPICLVRPESVRGEVATHAGWK